MRTLIIEKEGPVAKVWLNRPDVRNAFNDEVIQELGDIFAVLPKDPETRIVILGGKGKVFSAGADLGWLKSMKDATQDENYEDSKKLADLLDLINKTPKVTILRAHGAVLGGGMGIASVSDIVVSADDAQFGFPEIRLGLIPAVISSFVFPRIGPSAASRYFLTGERFSAMEAHRIGLVHSVVSPELLDVEVERITKELLLAGPAALSECKALLEYVRPKPEGDILKGTAGWISRLRIAPEGQEGMEAFLEKRPPNWVPKKTS